MSADSGAALAGNSGWLSLVNSGISSIGSVVGGVQQSSAANYNASIAQTQAQIATQEAGAEAAQQQVLAKRQIGAAIADAGASGVDPNQGSPANVVADMAQQGDLSRQLILYRGSLQSTALKQQAALNRYQGQQRLLSGIGTGGSSFLSSALKYLQSQTPSTDYYGSPA